MQPLVENLQQGVLFEDQQRRIRFVNLTFCDLFGITSPEAVLGADCAHLVEQTKSYTIEDLRKILKTLLGTSL